MKMELKTPVTQLENLKKNLTSKINQVEDRVSRLKDNVVTFLLLKSNTVTKGNLWKNLFWLTVPKG